MKNITVLVNTLKSGGAENQSVLLANTLSDDFKVYFIILNGKLYDKNLLDSINKNIQVIFLEKSILINSFQLIKTLKKNEISCLFTFLTLPNVIGSISGKIANVNKIYCGIRTQYLPKWKFLLEKYISNKLSTKIIFNNISGLKNMEKLGVYNSVYIPNLFLNIQAPISRKEKERINIISVGRFVKEKDFITAIKSFELLLDYRNVFFTIVGYGDLEDEIRSYVDNSVIKERINIIIKPNNIPLLLNQSDIYISTSLFEGTSNSILEAMNASLPIVATNVGDNFKLVKNGINGYLCEVSDYKSISKKIEFLINDFKLINSFGLKSNEILTENFSNSSLKTKYIELIND